MNNRKYTWIKQRLDVRDRNIKHLAQIRKFSDAPLPSKVSNRKYCPAVFDQGQLGSCTGNAWSGLLGYNECLNGKGGKLYRDRSRLFIYYNERVIENTVDVDSGAELRDGVRAIANLGVCNEGEWKYNIEQFTVKPSQNCYINAAKNKIHSYYSLDGSTPQITLHNLKSALANKHCFVFGFSVYDSFESQEMANTGILKMPSENENLLGGHAVMAIGYDDFDSTFLIRNSWGTGWGLSGNLSGYFKMPYEYISNPNLASDFWTAIN